MTEAELCRFYLLGSQGLTATGRKSRESRRGRKRHGGRESHKSRRGRRSRNSRREDLLPGTASVWGVGVGLGGVTEVVPGRSSARSHGPLAVRPVGRIGQLLSRPPPSRGSLAVRPVGPGENSQGQTRRRRVSPLGLRPPRSASPEGAREVRGDPARTPLRGLGKSGTRQIPGALPRAILARPFRPQKNRNKERGCGAPKSPGLRPGLFSPGPSGRTAAPTAKKARDDVPGVP